MDVAGTFRSAARENVRGYVRAGRSTTSSCQRHKSPVLLLENGTKVQKYDSARIVLETSDQRKLTMVEAASLQGTTLTDWFEEQVAASFARDSRHGA